MSPLRRSGRRRPTPRVAVIGGGFGGIAVAVRLRRKGIRDFVVFEQSGGVGGTWFDNHYPGAATDAPSHLYSYSFLRYPWTRTHARRSEVRDYLEHVVDRYGLRPHFRFHQPVTAVEWNEAAQHYLLTTGDGRTHVFNAVVSAVGMFGAARHPILPGRDEFGGRIVHTAHWPDDIDLRGATVAVMGTGSSAAQVVPAVADDARRVFVFQRQPGWLLPKRERAFTRFERAAWRWPGVWRLHRWSLYLRQDRREIGGRLARPRSRVSRSTRRAALEHVDAVFARHPELRRAVVPTYDFGGKRTVLSSAFYEALLRPDVELVPHAAVGLTASGVVDASGAERPVDVLITATGFEAADYLHGLDVIGRDGAKLHDVWNGEPFAFLGLGVPGFPNFFMLYGPNTNGGLIVSNLERQAAYAVGEISRLGRRRVGAVEVRADVTRWYNAWLQRRIAATAYTAAGNYYTAPSGKVVTQWPDSAGVYALLTLLLRRPSTLGRRTRRPGPPDRATPR